MNSLYGYGQGQEPSDFTVQIRRDTQTEGVVGTGIAVSLNGLILTCVHVVEEAIRRSGLGTAIKQPWDLLFHSEGLPSIDSFEFTVYCPQAVNSEERIQKAKMAAYSSEYKDDVILLKLIEEKLPDGLVPANLSVGQNPTGHNFRSFGYSRIDSYIGLPAEGRIIGFSGSSSQRLRCNPLRLDSKQIEGGMSGAAVLDLELNRVVGIIAETSDPDKSLRNRDTSFAVSTNVLTYSPFQELLENSLSFQDFAAYSRKRFNRDTGNFIGRAPQREQIKNWILYERSRLIVIWGMGGIGKTELATKAIDDIEDDQQAKFDYVWEYSLEKAPSLRTTLSEAIKFLSAQKDVSVPEQRDELIDRFLSYLRQGRHLILLDNAETVLRSNEYTAYDDDISGYQELLSQIASTKHDSCVIVTTREKPSELYELEGDSLSTHSLLLKGFFDTSTGIALCRSIAPIQGNQSEWNSLINHYGGNPLALKISSSLIKERYRGRLRNFLSDLKTIEITTSGRMKRMYRLLDEQFDGLDQFEQEILYWLAINREPTSASALCEDILNSPEVEDIQESLELLNNRSLVQSIAGVYYDLHPVIQEYVSNCLVNKICEEIESRDIDLFNAVALLKSQSRDYTRSTQEKFILQPIKRKLTRSREIRGRGRTINRLEEILRSHRDNFQREEGYLAGNVLDLMIRLDADMNERDFSNLCVWQSYLRNQELYNVNFSHSDLSKSVFTQTFGSILSLDFSPDGQLIATSDVNGYVRLWNASNGQPHLTIQAHRKWAWSVSFSSDNRRIASGSDDTTVKIWDTTTGQCLSTLAGHTQKVWAVKFNGEGNLVASGSEDNTIRIWDATTGDCIRILEGHGRKVWGLDFNEDDGMLVSSSQDGTAKVWDTLSWQCITTFNEHSNWVRSVAFSPDGKTVASGSNDRTIKIWDAVSGECLRTLIGHTHKVWSVGFDATGKRLVSGSVDQTIRVWDVPNGQCLNTLQGHTNWIRSVSFNPNNDDQVASGSDDQTTILWDVLTGERIYSLYGYTNRVWTVAVSPSGETLATGGDDYKIRLWNLHTGELLTTLEKHENWILSVAFSPDGETIASGSDDFQIMLWNAATGTHQRSLIGHTNKIWSISFSQTGNKLASGSRDGAVKVWDFSTGECLRTIEGHPSQENGVQAVSFSSDGRFIAIGCADPEGTILIWDCVTEEYGVILRGHRKRVWSVAFSPDAKYLASGSEDQTVKLWNIPDGRCIRTLSAHDNWVRSVAFSPDNRFLASGSDDTTVKLWDISSGKCLRSMEAHVDKVQSVTFDATGHNLISGSGDSRTIQWSVDTGEIVQEFRAKRPYEGTIITGISGVTDAQKDTLRALGAVEITS